jgi:ABC-type antimicrobial peptide transport system permease subunit
LIGTDIGYEFAISFGLASSAVFSIPYANIIEVSLIAYFFAVVATAAPVLQASRIAPAEALRYSE